MMGAIKFPKEQVTDDGSSCVTCQISTDGWPLLELNGYYQNNNLEAFRIYDISHVASGERWLSSFHSKWTKGKTVYYVVGRG